MILFPIIFNDDTNYDEVLDLVKRCFSINVLNYIKKSDNQDNKKHLYNTLSCIYASDFLKKNKMTTIKYNKAVKKAFFSLNYN